MGASLLAVAKSIYYFVSSNPSRPKCAKRSFVIKSINVRETNLLTYAATLLINESILSFIFF